MFGLCSKNGIQKNRKKTTVARSERQKEIQRRRHRRTKIKHLKKKIPRATVSEKAAIAEKIRRLTSGSEEIIAHTDLKDL